MQKGKKKANLRSSQQKESADARSSKRSKQATNNSPSSQGSVAKQKSTRRPLSFPRDLPDDDLAMRGPTGTSLPTLLHPLIILDYSNWIVKDHLLVGAYPLKPHMITAILQEGVTTFVCLMEEHEFGNHGKHYIEVFQIY